MEESTRRQVSGGEVASWPPRLGNECTVASSEHFVVSRAASYGPFQEEQAQDTSPRFLKGFICQPEFYGRGRLPGAPLLIQHNWEWALPLLITQPALLFASWGHSWNIIHLFIQSFTQKYCMSAYYVRGTVLGSGDPAVKKQNPPPTGVTFLLGGDR